MWLGREVKLLSDQVLDSVDVVEACGGHVNLEPRFVSLAKCIKVPESCSAEVDEMRENDEHDQNGSAGKS